MVVASSSDIGLILFWTWLIVASSSDIGLILFCNSSLWGLSCLVVITARSPKLWAPLINSHSFMQRLTNPKSRTVSSWLLIGLNLHERMWINQSGHTFGLFAVKAKSCYTHWFLASIKRLTLKVGIIPPFWKESNGFFKHSRLPWGSKISVGYLLSLFRPFCFPFDACLGG